MLLRLPTTSELHAKRIFVGFRIGGMAWVSNIAKELQNSMLSRGTPI